MPFLSVKLGFLQTSKKPFVPSPRGYLMLKNIRSCDTIIDPRERMTTVVTGQKPIVKKFQNPKTPKKPLCNHSFSRFKECFDW
jgi:hypothetical protein